MTDMAPIDTSVVPTAPAAAEPTSPSEASARDEIRVATRDDEEQLIGLLKQKHAEGGLLPLDEDRARDMFAKAFDRKGGIIAVIGEPGNVEAMIGLVITSFWYTRHNHIEQFLLYVRPDQRQTDHAKTLSSFARKCSDAIEIPLVIGLMSSEPAKAKPRSGRRKMIPSIQAAPRAREHEVSQ
jgi:hypothetical protein